MTSPQLSAPPRVVVIDDSRAELLAIEGLLRGLGLYIVREVIRRHGGSIDVRSSAGAGTTFVSRWPRVQDPASSDEQRGDGDPAPAG